MKRPKGSRSPAPARRVGFMLFEDVLRTVVERAACAPFARPAIYVVALNEPVGLALALELHALHGGPHPTDMRERAAREGLTKPLMTAAAPAASLARTVGAMRRDWADLAEAVRAVAAAGSVPVLLVADDVALVSSLEAPAEGDPDLGGWTLNAAGGEA